MKVSVITATFNSADTLEDTLRSVAEQNYPDIEHIIVDGGSTDATEKILKKYHRSISLIIREKDNGIYDALNKGIKAATGELIAFLHSDDIYADHNVISDYVGLFHEKKFEAVYADLNYVKRENTKVVTRKWRSGEYTKTSFLNGWMPPHPTFIAKSDLYKKHGGFDLRLHSAADYELMLRMIVKRGIVPGYLKRVTVLMRTGGQSNATLLNRIKANHEDRLVWKLNGLKPRFYTLYLKPLRKIFQFLTVNS